MITKSERLQIKALLQDSKWQVIERMVDFFCDKTRENTPLRETNDETLREFLLQEGRVQGVRSFLNELYNEASKSDE